MPHNGYMNKNRHTYTVNSRRFGQVTGNEFYLTRKFGKDIWNFYGEAVDHAVTCRCRADWPVEVPADPFGDPALLGPAPF